QPHHSVFLHHNHRQHFYSSRTNPLQPPPLANSIHLHSLVAQRHTAVHRHSLSSCFSDWRPPFCRAALPRFPPLRSIASSRADHANDTKGLPPFPRQRIPIVSDAFQSTPR